MITGGEPLLFPEKLANLAESIKTVQKLAYGNKGKLFLYTALADMLPQLYQILRWSCLHSTFC